MRITVQFQINNEPNACAITGVEGNVTNLILPNVGDMVSHRDAHGNPCVGRVSERMFHYLVPNGEEVGGSIMVLLTLDRSAVN